MANKKDITVIGAGLVGSLFSLQMAKKGHKVSLFEKRPDMRKVVLDGGRSINLIVTSRGINALRKVGIEDEVHKITVPVTGRMIHDLEGNRKFQPYGRDDSECNYSISRSALNKLLLDLAEKAGVQIVFEKELEKSNFDTGELKFGEDEIKADVVIGADGGGSITRKSLMNFFDDKDIDYSNFAEPLGAEYKELNMPFKSEGEYPIEKHALHIWPRGSHMLMALPNLDGSFTMTMYLPSQGEYSFSSLDKSEKLTAFLNKFYKSSLDYMPNILKEWKENPVGKLATVRCNNWAYKGKVVLLGDAAHGIVPFFGQGMNCGFEDCAYLDDFYTEFDGNFEKCFTKFNKVQMPNGFAIADMAIENFTEMKDKVGDERFLLRKQIEHKIEVSYPDLYRSRYGMVTYTLIPYFLAKKAGLIQDEILNELMKGLKTIEELDLVQAKTLIDNKFTPFIKEHKLELERFK